LTDRTKIPPRGGQYGIAPNNHIDEHLVKGPDDLPAMRQLVEAWAAAHPVGDLRSFIADIGDRGLVSALTQSALSYNAGDV
jgi:hypothetical protein